MVGEQLGKNPKVFIYFAWVRLYCRGSTNLPDSIVLFLSAIDNNREHCLELHSGYTVRSPNSWKGRLSNGQIRHSR